MQVVPGQRMVSDFDGEALQVYRALRHLNPSPICFGARTSLTDQSLAMTSNGFFARDFIRLENGI
ncbi:MAG: hypothetical protein U1E88_00720 [Acinetobacter sp.]